MGKVPLWGHFFAGWQAKVRPPMMSGGPWLGLKDTSGVLLPGKTEYSLPLRGTGADCHPLEQHGPKMPRAQWRKTLDGSRGSARPFRSPRTVNLTHRAGAHHFGRTTLELPRSRSHPGQGRSEESRPKPPGKSGLNTSVAAILRLLLRCIATAIALPFCPDRHRQPVLKRRNRLN